MDLKRFARVVAHGAKTRCGTGYLLDGERVLTARHVVEDAKTLTVQYDDLTERRKEKKAKALWKGKDDLDVAVLEVETELRLARQIFRPEPLTQDQPWRSRGWPRASPPPTDDTGNVAGSVAPLRGMAPEFAKTARRIELEVEASPQETEWWRGVSGAPVFCGRQLVGVITGGAKAYGGRRLQAVPVSALWEAPGFRENVGYDASVEEWRESRHRKLLDDLSDLLRKDRKAAKAIAERIGWNEVLAGPDDFDGLAKAICSSSSWREMLKALYSAYEDLSRKEGDRDALAVLPILERALPEVYGSTTLDVMGRGDTGHLITLPVETETLAELAIAAFDGRGLAYEEVRGRHHYPGGRVRLQLQKDELEKGFDPQGMQAWFDWLVLLAKWVELSTGQVQKLADARRLADLARIVNDAFAREVRVFGEPRRYFAYPSRFAASNRAFLAKVREHLPDLHLVELAGETLADELGECSLLQAILFRSTQTRNRDT